MGEELLELLQGPAGGRGKLGRTELTRRVGVGRKAPRRRQWERVGGGEGKRATGSYRPENFPAARELPGQVCVPRSGKESQKGVWVGKGETEEERWGASTPARLTTPGLGRRVRSTGAEAA